MRIATSTTYNQQITAIDNLSTTYQNIGAQLSTGKSLNAPGDGPTVIGQDLTIAGTIAGENGDVSNATAATNQLNFVDSTLSAVTNVLQEARSLTVSSATDVIPNGPQRQDMATQVQGMLQEVIGLANAQYAGKYVFAGTAPSSLAPITVLGSPPTGVSFTGNNDQQTTRINGQDFPVGTTMQQAFNQSSTDGTPSAFQLLVNLYNTLNTGAVVDTSGTAVNQPGQTILGTTTLGQLASTAPQVSAVPLTADNGVPPQYSFAISSVNAAGNAQSQTFTFTNATTVAGVVSAINAAQTAGNIEVKASWNVAEQKLVLTSSATAAANGGASPFSIANVATPGTGATTTANFTSAFHLQGQADTVNDLSTQLGEIDAVLNNVLNTRADVGARIQSLQSQTTQISAQSTDNTNIKSSYEDTNIAQATSQFTEVQTALQAAYAVTTRIEGKSLLDYLPV